MNTLAENMNEQYAADAFTAQSVIFDETYSNDTIVNYKRQRVRDHVLKYIKPHGTILELNSGTGEDAVFFAKHGYKVHATDISEGMQNQIFEKIKGQGLENMISIELCSYTQLDNLSAKGPYDYIFSNFAGLNCTGELDKVLLSLPQLLNANGVITLVVLPKFCLWETLLLFKGKFKTAFRRFFSNKGRRAHLEGVYFTCWYYSPSYIIKTLKSSFDLLSIEGLCTVVPPSYIQGFAEKYPGTYDFLKKTEDKLKYKWPWKYVGDYYIISLRKK